MTDLTKNKRARAVVGEKLRGAEKVALIPIKVLPTETPPPKPEWIRIRLSNSPKVNEVKRLMRENNLHTVCEEAQCPNLQECFSGGTATFMIMGDICTRRCPFCDVAHGRPNALDADEPQNLAKAIAKLDLKYVVITSVDRDDLRDGGADHFRQCIEEVRKRINGIKIEVLVPDFRGRMDIAIELMQNSVPDVFNHNLETIPRLYKQVRPGSDYAYSLQLLQKFKKAVVAQKQQVLTKSGIMVGLGETQAEVEQVITDLHAHDVDMVTIGQYLQPSKSHLPVVRYVPLEEFAHYQKFGENLGFHSIASGPMVRSSYHADQQAKNTFGSPD